MNLEDDSQNGIGVGTIISRKYKLEEKLGQGSFGMIFKCVNLENQQICAMKLEKRNQRHSSMLVREIKVMMELKEEFGYARMISYGKDENYNYVVMTSLGKNLDQIIKRCGQHFSVSTCMNIADQMLARLEVLHNHNLIHRDIKPENFVIGSERQFHLIYLIDFGLAKYYKDGQGNHIPVVEKKGMIGTARYASINAHSGIEQSRRDDLEALGYVLLYCFRGKLPWSSIYAESKEEKYEKIKNMKMNCPLEQLCEGCPNELVLYLKAVRKLEFVEQPNYQALRALFRKVIIDRKLEAYINFVDWETLPDYRHRKKESSHSDISLISSQKDIALRQQQQKKISQVHSQLDSIVNQPSTSLKLKKSQTDQVQLEKTATIDSAALKLPLNMTSQKSIKSNSGGILKENIKTSLIDNYKDPQEFKSQDKDKKTSKDSNEKVQNELPRVNSDQKKTDSDKTKENSNKENGKVARNKQNEIQPKEVEEVTSKGKEEVDKPKSQKSDKSKKSKESNNINLQIQVDENNKDKSNDNNNNNNNNNNKNNSNDQDNIPLIDFETCGNMSKHSAAANPGTPLHQGMSISPVGRNILFSNFPISPEQEKGRDKTKSDWSIPQGQSSQMNLILPPQARDISPSIINNHSNFYLSTSMNLGNYSAISPLNNQGVSNNSFAFFGQNIDKRLSSQLQQTHASNLLNVPNQGSASQASLANTSKLNNYSGSDSDTILEEGGIQISTTTIIDRNASPMNTSEIRRDIRTKSLIIRQSQLEIHEIDLNRFNHNSSNQNISFTMQQHNNSLNQTIQQIKHSQSANNLNQVSLLKFDASAAAAGAFQLSQAIHEAQDLLSHKNAHQGLPTQNQPINNGLPPLANGNPSKGNNLQNSKGVQKNQYSPCEDIKEHQDEDIYSNGKIMRQYKTQITPITEVKESSKNSQKTKNSRSSFFGENITESLCDKNPIMINVIPIKRAFKRS